MNFKQWKKFHGLSDRTDTVRYIWKGTWIDIDGSETPGELYGWLDLGTGEYTPMDFFPDDGSDSFDPGENVKMDWADVRPDLDANKPKNW